MADEEDALGLAFDPMLERECSFCRIARGEEEANIVCESEQCLAFLPEMPATPGHTLVIPRGHVQNVFLADRALGGHLMSLVLRVGAALEEILHPEGMNLISSAGSAAAQSVPHLHLHVVPRWAHDAIGDIWPPKKPMDARLEDELANRIREACTGA
jgi:histidine triad (HIT) family protein